MGYYDSYLEHHGILGQKWGVRRFENKNGHLTAAGLKRYEDGRKVTKAEQTAAGRARQADYEKAKSETKKAKDAYKKASQRANATYSKTDKENANRAQGLYDLRKKQQSDAKARMQMNSRAEKGKKIGKHELKLIEKFKEKGMSQEEAEVAAYKRAKLEKTLAIAAGVTVAVAAAYGAKKYHDYVSDEVLEVGKVKMKRIEADDNIGVHDTFYAAFGKKDITKYEGMYGNQVRSYNGAVHQKTIDLKENLKIASDKNAKNAMSEVLSKSSPESKNELVSQLERYSRMLGDGKQGKMLRKGLADIKAGKYDTKAAYDAFNFNMTGGNKAKVYDEFKSHLKSKGYAGIKDRNDASYSGYNAKTARIIFDTAKIKVSDVRKLSDAEITNKYASEMRKAMLREATKQSVEQNLPMIGMIGAGAAAGTAINKSARTKENNKAIADYKREHPGTKLSNDEILENYYGGKK